MWRTPMVSSDCTMVVAVLVLYCMAPMSYCGEFFIVLVDDQ